MATRSTAILFDEAGLGGVFNHALQSRREVLSAVYTAHYHHVLRVCRRFFRRPEDAEDAAAEVFLKLHSVLDKKDEEHPFRPWMCQIAGRHCIDKLRRGKREKYSVSLDNDFCVIPDISTPSPLYQVLHKEKNRLVREEVDRLPDYYKVPLMLRYYQRMSYSQIARKLNRSLPAAKSIIYRAKNRLRGNLAHLAKGGELQTSCTLSSRASTSHDLLSDLPGDRADAGLSD